jgi:hypothetical protein
MKKIILFLIAFAWAATSAQAAHYNPPSCVPAYIKTHNNAAVSAFFLPPLLILNVMARAGDLPNNGKHLHGLSCTTLAVAKSASGRQYRRER